jgi:hypothetical protein
MRVDVSYARPINGPAAYYIEVDATRAEAGEPHAPEGVVPSGRFAGAVGRITTGYPALRIVIEDAARAAGLPVAGLRYGLPSHGPGYVRWSASLRSAPRGLGVRGEEA